MMHEFNEELRHQDEELLRSSQARDGNLGFEERGNDPNCHHLLLTKHWDSVEDMGKDDMITSYTCNGCSAAFTPEEAEELQRRQHTMAL